MQYVYAITHPYMPGLVKFGLTKHDPEGRARSLKATGVPGNFKVLGFVEVDDARTVERRIHTLLDHVRVDPRREFFKISQNKALIALSAHGTVSNSQSTLATRVRLLFLKFPFSPWIIGLFMACVASYCVADWGGVFGLAPKEFWFLYFGVLPMAIFGAGVGVLSMRKGLWCGWTLAICGATIILLSPLLTGSTAERLSVVSTLGYMAEMVLVMIAGGACVGMLLRNVALRAS